MFTDKLEIREEKKEKLISLSRLLLQLFKLILAIKFPYE